MRSTQKHASSAVRLFIFALGLALVWVVLGFFAGSDSARADDRDSRSLLGGVVSGVVDSVKSPLSDLGSATDSLVAPVAKPVAPVVKTVAPVVKTVAPVVKTVAPVVKTVVPVVKTAAPVVKSVTDVIPAPVKNVVPAVQTAISDVVAAKPVTSIVTPVVDLVDNAVGVIPVVKDLPVVSDILGTSPIGDITTPITGVVDGVLIGVIGGVDAVIDPLTGLPQPNVPTTPGAPAGPGAPAPDPGLPGDGSAVADPALAVTTAFSLGSTTMTSSQWAANLNSRADASSTASARAYPDPVPQGPAENGHAAPPSPSGTSNSAASGGPSGSSVAADHSSASASVLITGALLSHAENDALPLSVARDLSSTPD